MDKQLLLFGLMLKAGRIIVGDEPVTDAIRRGEVDVLCVAQDAAENTLRRFTRYAEEEGLPFLRLPYDKSTFGGVFGRSDVAVAGVTDVGFAAKLLELAVTEDASLTDAAARYRKKADAIVEEQKKKRHAQKQPAWQKKTPVPATEQPVREDKKPAVPPRDSREPNARSFENREAPGKVYGKAPRSQSVPIGERRRGDAVRNAEKQERYGERKPYGDKPAYGEKKPYGDKPAYGEKKPYGDKPAYGERKPYGGKPAYGEKKPYGDKPAYGERKPYGGKPAYGEKKPYGDKPAYGERKPYGGKPAYGEKKPYGDKPAYGEKKPYGDKPAYGERKPYGGKPAYDEKKPYGDKPAYGEKKPYGDKPAYGERKPYGGKPAYGEKKPYGDKPAYGEKKPYGGKPAYGEKKPYGDKPAYGERKPYGGKPAYGEKKPYGDKPAYGERKPYGGKPAYGEKKPYGANPNGNGSYNPRDHRTNIKNAPRSASPAPSYRKDTAAKRPYNPSVKRGNGGKA